VCQSASTACGKDECYFFGLFSFVEKLEHILWGR
jgi:hypothetical protein